MGQWHRDRDCEPAQLTERQATVSARMGQETPLVYRAQKPCHGRPVGGVFASGNRLDEPEPRLQKADALERRNEALERAVAAEEAKLSPRQRAIVDGKLAERDPT